MKVDTVIHGFLPKHSKIKATFKLKVFLQYTSNLFHYKMCYKIITALIHICMDVKF